MAVTLKEVAERAGVSRSAVSRTFTDGASVSDKMRRKVEKAARELGYSPNALASSLTTGRTKLIGLISDNFHNPFFLKAFDVFTSGLQARDLRPLLVNLTSMPDPDDAVQMLRQYSVDGVIVASSTVPPSFATLFEKANIPAVFAFARYRGSANSNVVGIDNEFAGAFAARTLIERGYRNIAYLGGPQAAVSTTDRLKGFSAEMASHGLGFTHTFSGKYSFQAGRTEMLRLIDQGDLAEVYFGADDIISIGALSALESRGIRVPEDVGILGLNDLEMAGWENINLTTIRQPIGQIASASVDLMVSLLDEPGRHPEARLFPCTLIERGTLKPLKIGA
ncbi:LacI family DNA-binding transcriptional regulator [Aliiroseovarius sp. KMU-50]|uniref:LacI family DNA-binding transcriptional regulator n=1 Tax=Aliiroseovarius salicola TaxID=3009082 RepID=A0ABT4W4F8_9RHOB|nr:LacI family DNA-binding transcriptional regulator [Aliiroseovarius sp. KMU-50]MDA5094623.1 LacI family DNA-binding transcriptional regulator [Aliiroseovarius sp. KMU-50]